MFGKQGGIAKAPVFGAILGKKNSGAVKGAGQVKQGTTVTPVKGSKNKLK
jgi:hypothetical protein